MKKTLSLLTLCVAVSALCAQTMHPCVVVEQTNGNTANYLLSATPRITYAAGEVRLTTTSATVVLASADVAKVYLSETDATGIHKTEVSVPVRISLRDGSLALSGLPAGSRVTLYATDGSQLGSGTADSAGMLSLSLGKPAAGIVIVKTNCQTFKIIQK